MAIWVFWHLGALVYFQTKKVRVSWHISPSAASKSLITASLSGYLILKLVRECSRRVFCPDHSLPDAMGRVEIVRQGEGLVRDERKCVQEARQSTTAPASSITHESSQDHLSGITNKLSRSTWLPRKKINRHQINLLDCSKLTLGVCQGDIDFLTDTPIKNHS